MSVETYSVEYPCDWACRIELDLDDIHVQYTHGQMRRAVDACHRTVHEDPGAPVRAEYTVTNMRAGVGTR